MKPRCLVLLISAVGFAVIVAVCTLPTTAHPTEANITVSDVYSDLSDTTFQTGEAIMPVRAAYATSTLTPVVYLPLIMHSLPPGVSVLNNHTTYTSGSSRYIVGEVYNNTASQVWVDRVAVNFYNGSQLVDTSYSYLSIDPLRPYEKTCFKIYTSEPPTWTHYIFEPPSYGASSTNRPNLTVTFHTGGVYTTTYSSSYRILGQVRNDEAVNVLYAAATATLYDSAGNVLECDSTSVNSSNLSPGQVSSFKMFAGPPDPYAVSSYVLQTDGIKSSAMPPPGNVDVLSNHTTYTSGSSRYIVGEVYNNTPSQVQVDGVSVNFFNGGQLVDTAHIYLNIGPLRPYEKTCFKIYMNEPPTWTHYTFEQPSYWASNTNRPNLTVTFHTGSVYTTTYSSNYRILGQVRNDETVNVRYAIVGATLYDSAEKVLECYSTSVNSSNLSPGQVSSFEMFASPPDPYAVTSYVLQTDGTK